jgi:hypothetical protein
MSFRISRKVRDGGAVLEVEGELAGAEAARVLADEIAESAPVAIELGGVITCDPASLAVLSAGAAAGASLRGGGAYMQALLGQWRGRAS